VGLDVGGGQEESRDDSGGDSEELHFGLREFEEELVGEMSVDQEIKKKRKKKK
jgi:hypothetical protein